MTSNVVYFPVSCGLLDRRPSAALGRISGLLAQSSAALVESSLRLAFWADFGARLGRFGALFGAVRPREADFHIFVQTRCVHTSDDLLDPILGPLGSILRPILGLLGLSWALIGGRTSCEEGPEEA